MSNIELNSFDAVLHVVTVSNVMVTQQYAYLMIRNLQNGCKEVYWKPSVVFTFIPTEVFFRAVVPLSSLLFLCIESFLLPTHS